MARLLVCIISFAIRVLRAVIRSRADLIIENVALRQQVAALMKQRRSPALDDGDRAFWVALRAAWPRWTNALVIVKADTVAKWHRERFRRHWAAISRHPCPPHLLSRRVIRQSQTPVVMHSLQKDQCRTRPEPQQCLYFFPLPQGQGALRPTFDLLAAVLG